MRNHVLPVFAGISNLIIKSLIHGPVPLINIPETRKSRILRFGGESLSQKVVWLENITSNLRHLPGLHHWNAAECQSFFKYVRSQFSKLPLLPHLRHFPYPVPDTA